MMRRNRAGKQKANPSNRMEGTGSQKQPDILFLRCEMKGTQEEHPSLALRVADEEGGFISKGTEIPAQPAASARCCRCWEGGGGNPEEKLGYYGRVDANANPRGAAYYPDSRPCGGRSGATKESPCGYGT